MTSAKVKIDECVKKYAELFPAELESFKKWSAEMRKDKTDKFARTSKDSASALERKLGEIPEMLFNMIRQSLAHDEWMWFQADGPYRGDYKGQYWFYKKYPIFAITEV